MLAVRNWNLVVFLSTIAIITFVGICVLALWLKWEMGKAKGVLNEIRSRDNKDETEKAARDNKDKPDETEKCWYLWLKKIFSWPKKCFYPSQVTPGSSDDVSATKTLETLVGDYQEKMKQKSWYLWP